MAHLENEYMDILKLAYRNHQLVPFVGAGLSLPFEMPGWGTLIDGICKRFDYEILTGRREKISRLIKEYRYLDAVDEMIRAGILEDDLKSAICSAIQRKKQLNIQEPDNIYKDLVKMNCTKYLTTNYDNYLSDYVETKLDILQKKTNVDRTKKVNHIKDIASKAIGKTQKVSIPKGEPVVIDAPALYILFNMGEKQQLKDNVEVFITFTTIEQLHNVYCYCGDGLIFEIIEHIRNAHNIHLASPSLEGALNNRENYPDIIQGYFDSLTLAFEKEYPFVTAYHLPVGFRNGSPVMLPEGFKAIKVVNQEILVYTGN